MFVRDGVADKAGKVAKKPPKDQFRIANITGDTIDSKISLYGYFKPLSSWTLVSEMESLGMGAPKLVACVGKDEHPLSHYTAFALVVEGMTAEVKLERMGDDLRIDIETVTEVEGDAPAKPKMNGAVLCYGDGAEDMVRPNNLGEKPITLRVWAYDKKQAAWLTLCTVPDLAPGEARKIKTEYKGDLDQFDTFAVYETSNAKIECRAEEIHSDLFLSVSVVDNMESETAEAGTATE